ncbi:guanine nucleotide-binding protein alpha-2 subunit [Basidiobolus meristosporus CBS 931.73]|uniref:Guanine nucleotide-binding protein alpha-2 subunit n=1 Tax=Basidiobolus meristosporus CBS 931.73 TaxID=1314790 RepID=A0A1Y1XGK4_9FUNG|nr:guanine nucleotide-binding protein alpha-2 subunit [Basidiobolus meristosporus CBS 931.73]|eukprot:ORX84853.1 guanine nucleotide-binding protein alpha-2 subunit [Basidiobolus meristosporus CBS 931.73]
MGNCFVTPSISEEQQKTRLIEKQLRAEAKRAKSEIKILLLGAGESGKSTILKQMRLIHNYGFTSQEREVYRTVIFRNAAQAIRDLLLGMEVLHIPLSNQENARYIPLFEEIPELDSGDLYPQEYLDGMRAIWQDAGAQSCYQKANLYQLDDNAIYYFESLDRLSRSNYSPSDQDILYARIKTTGISETVFDMSPLTYRMVDVGGQRSERKKWIHCFENVTALLFLVAISGYDQTLAEDRDTNRMHEALMLFDSICNSYWFERTSVILFLNKIDLFREKIKHSPVSKYFPDYKGPNDSFNRTSAYFTMRFESLNRSPEKVIYSHLTYATDTSQIRHIMASVNDIILSRNLKQLSF